MFQLLWHAAICTLKYFTVNGRQPSVEDDFIDALIHYKVTTTRSMKVSALRIRQYLREVIYNRGLSEELQIYSGSMWEGMPFEVCGDRDFMKVRRNFPIVCSEAGHRYCFSYAP